MPQSQLQAVVVAVAASLPTVERGELRLVERERRPIRSDKTAQRIGTSAGTRRITECVEILQRESLVAEVRVIEVIDILRSGGIAGRAGSSTDDVGRSSRLRKQMFP